MNRNVLVWLDLETTTLNPDTGKILEVGIIITDWQLNELAERSWIIGWSDEELGKMDPFVINMHTRNGLLTRVRQEASEPACHQDNVEHEICRFLLPYRAEASSFLLAGNSINFDRSYIKKHMPLLDSLLHHRTIDVTPFGLLIEAWCPEVYKKARGDMGVRSSEPPSTQHRAIDDIKKSIAWMRAYKTHGFDVLCRGPVTPEPVILPVRTVVEPVQQEPSLPAGQSFRGRQTLPVPPGLSPAE